MKRRRRLPTDSLELLLDTICNTFGGVLFIAILVVILLRLSGDAVQPSQVGPRSTAAESQNLQEQLEILKFQESRLQDVIQAQKQTLTMLAPADLREQVEQLQLEENRGQRLQIEFDMQKQTLDAAEMDQATLTESVLKAEQALAKVHSENDVLQEELELERTTRESELRTSVVKSSGIKREVVAILQYDRFYIWHRYNSQGDRQGLNTADFLVLNNGVNKIETTPNPIAGIPVTETAGSKQEILERLRRFQNNRVYFAVIVRPDSFSSFKLVRDVLFQAGFEYDLVPSLEDVSFVDRGGTGGKVQ